MHELTVGGTCSKRVSMTYIQCMCTSCNTCFNCAILLQISLTSASVWCVCVCAICVGTYTCTYTHNYTETAQKAWNCGGEPKHAHAQIGNLGRRAFGGELWRSRQGSSGGKDCQGGWMGCCEKETRHWIVGEHIKFMQKNKLAEHRISGTYVPN